MVHLKPKKKHSGRSGSGLTGEGKMSSKDMHQWLKAMGGKLKG